MSDKWPLNVLIAKTVGAQLRDRVRAIKAVKGDNATSINKEAEKALIIGLRELEKRDE